MNTLEDRVRAATRGTAAEIAPGSIPTLSLPARGPRPAAAAGARRDRSPRRRLLVPLAAAAAVIAVVGASVAVTRLAHRAGLPAGTVPLASATGSAAGTGPGSASPAGSTAAGALPPYYVALEPGAMSDGSTRAVVRATTTGALLATLRPPAPYRVFSDLTGAADDRAFVLAAQAHGEPGPPSEKVSPEKFFLLRLDPAAGTATLTALPIPEEPPGEEAGIALAPDGSKLAIASVPSQTEQEMTVVNLRTGSARTWQGRFQGNYYIGGVVLAAGPLSWTADGRTLAFEQEAPLPGNPAPGQPVYSLQVRLLDTAAPGSNLWSSRVVAISGDATNAMITPDGTKIVAPVATQTAREVAEYSVSTGQLVAVLGIRHYQHADNGDGAVLYWASRTGSTVIVNDAAPGTLNTNGDLDSFPLAAVTGSQFTPLPGHDTWGAW